ncbi:transcriptional regulator, GntR family [Lachnospiraceae bacterium KM106-2]|nr:transcriptional regulator, GntR family [Lachnospiraceae bacterium KM106-2]
MFSETSMKPLFVQIYEWIEDEIINGNLKEGDQVPSTNQFAAQYRINPATAGKGINVLVEENILFKKRGIGMFVAEGACEVIRTKRKKQFCNEYIRPMVEEARKLGLQESEIENMIRDGFNKGDLA